MVQRSSTAVIVVVRRASEYPNEMAFESKIKDGRKLEITHVEPQDAAEMAAYINRVRGESDFLTSGPGELEISVEDETKFIANFEGGRFNFMLKGFVDGQIVSSCHIMRRKR